jgi:hypothetical protein
MPGKSEYSPGASVFMLSVKDEAKAREMLGRLLAALEPFLTQNNGLIDDAKIEGAEGFKVIVHPMLAMIPGFAQPTLGVKDGQLFLGSSLKAVGVALDAAAGKSPNFGSNQRFLKEGLPLEKNLISVGFTDMTNMGRELGAMLKMVPMIGMFAPQIAQHPVGKAVMSVAGKLGNVVQELNFYQSSFSETTLDGDTLYTKSILNYREPPKEPVTTAPAESESGGKTP